MNKEGVFVRRYSILKYINENENITQRNMSKALDISVGNINSAIKSMELENLIEIKKKSNKQLYSLTKNGFEYMEKYIQKNKLEKISIHKNEEKKISQAVILAAGEKDIFKKPVSFLDLEDGKIIDRVIDILNNNGIEKIVIITGYKNEYFKVYENNPNITLVKSE